MPGGCEIRNAFSVDAEGPVYDPGLLPCRSNPRLNSATPLGLIVITLPHFRDTSPATRR